MKGVVFSIEQSSERLQIEVDPLLCDENITADDIAAAVGESEFADMVLLPDAIAKLDSDIKAAKAEGNMDAIISVIGEPQQSGISIELAKDLMSATMTVKLPAHMQLPNFNEVLDLLGEHNIKRGISKKRIQNLLSSAHEGEPGT